jgi:hypothetical protein
MAGAGRPSTSSPVTNCKVVDGGAKPRHDDMVQPHQARFTYSAPIR